VPPSDPERTAGDPGYRALLVLSAEDPVARAVGAVGGVGASLGEHLDGVPFRSLGDGLVALGRPGPHLADDGLDARLPASVRGAPMIFPSIHRSDSGARCLTVHPLGNPGASAELGGRPRTLVPADARAMTGALRALAERAAAVGLPATFEATHHGPALGAPAFFAEIAVAEDERPSDAEVRVLVEALRGFRVDPSDRVAVGAGGGHYAPHFTDLALRRRWAFGHLLSRHALATIDAATARASWEGTAGAEGILFARAQDRDHPAFRGLGAPLRDGDAPAR